MIRKVTFILILLVFPLKVRVDLTSTLFLIGQCERLTLGRTSGPPPGGRPPQLVKTQGRLIFRWRWPPLFALRFLIGRVRWRDVTFRSRSSRIR